MAVNSSTCQFYKYGYCRYRDTCRNLHIEENCENLQCDVSQCQKRHPRACKYFTNFKRCKFGNYCKFRHDLKENGLETTLSTKVLNLENKVASLLEEKKVLDNKLKDLRREN